jgi:hypothetical protein
VPEGTVYDPVVGVTIPGAGMPAGFIAMVRVLAWVKVADTVTSPVNVMEVAELVALPKIAFPDGSAVHVTNI